MNACDRARMKERKMCFSICGEWVTWLPPSVSSWIGCRGPEATRPIEHCKWCSCSVVVVVVVVAFCASVIPLRSSWAVKYLHAELSRVKIQTAYTAAHPIGGAITRPAIQGPKRPAVGIKHVALLFLGAERGWSLLNITKSFCAWLYFLHRRVLPGRLSAILRCITQEINLEAWCIFLFIYFFCRVSPRIQSSFTFGWGRLSGTGCIWGHLCVQI